MCGFAGSVGPSAAQFDGVSEPGHAVLQRRGPDSKGTWLSRDGSVRMQHFRLAIRDLSPAGHQPMVSSCGRFTLAYNGELYAVEGLRRRLSARRLRGRSDTEVLLEASAEWGLERVLPELVGMFAFALWDDQARRMTLVRDRLGVKPLYWSHRSGSLSFASEPGALRAIDPAPRELDRDAIVAYLRLNHFPGDLTVHTDIRRLRPGERLTYENGTARLDRWWDGAEELVTARREGRRGTDAESLERLDESLCSAVRDRLVADVPIGSLLSGGIDSTLVTALMVETSDRPIRTFTVGVDDARYDESAKARAIAHHLGTEHTEVRLSATEALELIPSLPVMFGEPFADASAIPTAMVFAQARGSLSVTMSGDGGDEVFAGYPHHWRTRALMRRVAPVPSAVRPGLARGLRATSDLLGAFGRRSSSDRLSTMSRRLRKAGGVMAAADIGDAYRSVVSQWEDPASLVRDGSEPASLFDDPRLRDLFADPLDRMQALDLLGTLPDDILTKVDRASMWSSDEARVPLLDHRLLRVVWGLPTHLRLQGRTGKVALRRLLEPRVPTELWDGPKQGFGVPLDTWLRGPLRDWAEELLSVRSLEASGALESAPIRHAWERHLGGGDESHALWGVLSLQAWLADGSRATP